MSQVFERCLCFCFMKCRIFNKKESTKTPCFFVIKSKLSHKPKIWETFIPIECHEEACKVSKGLVQYQARNLGSIDKSGKIGFKFMFLFIQVR